MTARWAAIALLPLALAACGDDAGKTAALEARVKSLETRLDAVEARVKSPEFALPTRRGDLEPK